MPVIPPFLDGKVTLLGKWRHDNYTDDPEAVDPTLIWPWARGHLLSGHLGQCLNAVDFLLTENGFGRNLHHVMALPVDYDQFSKLCRTAVLCHDLGKCGYEFQTMLWKMEKLYRDHFADGVKRSPLVKIPFEDRHSQLYRHEHLSFALCLTNKTIRKWIVDEVGEEGVLIVAAAAFGHHRKTDKSIESEITREHPVFLEALSTLLQGLTRKGFNNPFPLLSDETISPEKLVKDIKKSKRACDDVSETNLSIAVKWVTILADSLGSVSNASRSNYHSDTYNPLSHREDIQQGTWRDLKDRLNELDADLCIDYKGRIKNYESIKDSLHPFQQDAEACQNDGLLMASCGGGKSTAAFLWASNSPEERLLFCLPTTATATQMRLDYGEIGDANRHSRSSVDKFLTLGENPQDKAHEGATDEEKDREAILSRQLQDYRSEVVFTTYDQVLGVLSFHHKSIMWLPYIVKAQLVFDEVHALSPELFKWYRLMLKLFPNMRTFSMSATIPNARKSLIVGQRPGITIFLDKGKDRPASIPRYRIQICHHTDAGKGEANLSPKTLWIQNQVDAVQTAAWLNPSAICYHSRFRYVDRRQVHTKLIEGFRSDSNVTAVTSQVASMSLDISANKLVSAVCPIEEMIQRMGRLNRASRTNVVREAFFYMPEKGYPYDMSEAMGDFKPWFTWLKQLQGKDISQNELEEAFLAVNSLEYEVPLDMWGVTTTLHMKLREDEYMMSCLLASDVHRLRASKDYISELERRQFEISAPLRGVEVESYRKDKYHFVLPASQWQYEQRRGLIRR